MRLARRTLLGVNAVLVIVLLLALGLRLYRIQAQSLWNDEGTSVALAGRDLASITRGAANDIHPPLYYYILHFWIRAFGNSELAVRSLSALLGTLLVLLVFALGRVLAGRCGRDGDAVGLLAAFLAAVSPFLIYYSQEARMYALSAFLGAASMLALSHLLFGECPAFSSPSYSDHVGRTAASHEDARQPASIRCRLTVAVYIVSTILLLYSHYFAATLVVAQNLAVFCWWLVAGNGRARSGALRRWATLQAGIGLAFLPWLLLAGRQLGVWPAISEPLHLMTLALDLLRVFSLGLFVEPHASPVLAGFVALLLLGIVAPWFAPRDGSNRGHGRAAQLAPHVLVLLYLFAPIGIMFMLSLRRPMYNPKFLLPCMPAFYILLAQGAVWLAGTTRETQDGAPAPGNASAGAARMSRGAPSVVLLLLALAVVVASLQSLHAYFWDSRYARDDYRSIAQYIQAVAGANDAVLINAPGQLDTFSYYYHGSLPLYPLPRQRPLDEAQTEADLQQLTEARSRIFAVLWATDESDPQRFVEGWLDQHAYKATDSWYGNVRLVVYAVPAEPSSGQITNPLDVNLGNKVRLLGYNLPTPRVMPGDILQLTLFWQAIAPMTERFKVFTHILDAHGHLVGQRDAEPGGGAKITTIWKPGEQVVDNYGLLVLPATPPGEYTVEVGLYGLNDGQRLPVMEGAQAMGDHILLQPVRILPASAPPPLSVLAMRGATNVQFGDVLLLGYDLAKLGYEHQPDAPLHAGDVLHLTLFWQARHEPQADLSLVLRLLDERGAVRLEQTLQPTDGEYPARRWRPDEIVRDQHNLPLAANLPAGRYTVQLVVQRLPDGQPLARPIALTNLTLK